MFLNISTARGGGGSVQPYGTHRKRVCKFQLVRKAMYVRFTCFEVQLGLGSGDLRFNCFGFQIPVVWDSSDLVVTDFNCFARQLLWGSSDLRLSCLDTEVMWGSTANRCNFQLIWGSTGLRLKWDEDQVMRFEWFQIISNLVVLGLNRFGSHSVWDAICLRVIRFQIHLICDSCDLTFNGSENVFFSEIPSKI